MATPMQKQPEPALEYVPIPKERYTSREFAQREWERMWTRVWLLAGREQDAARPGDYFTFEIGPESILVIRQHDGSLAARFNVCMHRGNRLREPGRGHADEFSCLIYNGHVSDTVTTHQLLDLRDHHVRVPAYGIRRHQVFD